MKEIVRKGIQFAYSVFHPNMKIDLLSDITPGCLKQMGTHIQVKQSIIQGDIKFGVNCIIYKACIRGLVRIGNYVTLNGGGIQIYGDIYGIQIGNYCSIGPNVVIQENYHKMDRITTYHIMKNVFRDEEKKKGDIYSKGKIIIEDDVWIGANAVILSGVKIGRGSVIGAGSIVTKNVSPYTLIAGNPAKEIKKRFNENQIKILEKSGWWLWTKEELKHHKMEFCKSSSESNFLKGFMMEKNDGMDSERGN